MKTPLLVLVLVALATACVQPPPPPPDPNAVVRLEVSPAALLMTAAGEKHPLTVWAFNAAGQPVVSSASATWTSSRPEQVGVSASGELEARTALGSSQIVAQVGGVQSAPVLVSVAQPAAGVVLVTDAQIRGAPALVDESAEPDPDNPYEVVLTGIAPPAPGSLLLGREGKAVGGEVVSSVQEGDAVRVRLKLVPVTQLMAQAEIKETVDFTNLPLQLPPEIARDYDVRQTGDEYVFTPKPAAPARGGGVRPLAIKEFKLGPYTCEFATPELPISLGQPGQFSLKFSPSLEIDFDRQTGLRKLIARAELGAKMKAALVLSAGGVLNLDCTATLYTKLLPLPGWAGLILAGELKAGIGFEIEGATSFPLGGVELSSETKGTLEMGLDCTSGECNLVRGFNPTNTTDVRFVKPQVANIRPAEVFIFGYGFAKIKAGMTLIDKLRMDVVTARAGLKLEGSFAPPSTQLEPSTNALEPDYQSSYKLGGLAEVVAGSINKAGDSAFRKLLQKLGVFKFNLFKFQFSKTLAGSPKGTATQNKTDFKAGDQFSFTVNLEPSSAVFPFIGYNVQRVLIMRKDGSSPAEVIASVDAAPGQLEFTLPWVADADSTSPRGQAFYAFVDTKLPVPFDLEIAKVQPAAPGQGFIHFRYDLNFSLPRTSSGNDSCTTVNSQSSSTAREQHDIRFDLQPSNAAGTVWQTTKVTGSYLSATQEQSRKVTTYTRDCTGLGANGRGKELKGCVLTLVENKSKNADQPVTDGTGNAILALDPDKYRVTFFGNYGQVNVARSVNLSTSGCSFFQPEQFTDPPGTVSGGIGGRVVSAPLDPALPAPKLLRGTDTQNVDCGGNGTTCTETLSADWEFNLGEAPTVDLELGVIAPATAAPDGKLTYAVNLHNKTQNAANNIRAEFFLPDGFRVLDTQGWSGCVTVLTTVTCKAATLEGNERRAFLVDVQAPASGGEYIMTARVSSDERETNSSDNLALGATLIVQP
jgi:hypothetical protein